MEIKLLKAREVAEILSVSMSQFYKLRADGKLPKPITLKYMSGVRWRLKDIDQFIETNTEQS